MTASGSRVSDLRPAQSTPAFLRDVIEGLSRSPKMLPCKYLYDARGAELFERICTLEEYYPTRAETEIMSDSAGEMAAHVGPDAAVIEPGSGAGIKTRLLLQALAAPAAYIPIDISDEQLARTAREISCDFPELYVAPVHADFATGVPLPPTRGQRRLIYFPGSTIGNFDPPDAAGFLKRLAAMAGPTGCLLIGADLKKDARVLEAAYNDGSGITAQFNLNMLRRINRELGANFDLSAFEHTAVYNAAPGRIEMRLISKGQQRVRIAGHEFDLQPGEWIHTESSHKYAFDDFEGLLMRGGWRAKHRWLDSRERFSVFYAER